jgi:hypothetical protein
MRKSSKKSHANFPQRAGEIPMIEHQSPPTDALPVSQRNQQGGVRSLPTAKSPFPK